MAEEFAEFMESINGKPIKEKLDVLTNIIEKVISVFVRFMDDINNKIKLLEDQVSLYENPIKNEKIEIQNMPKPHNERNFRKELGDDSVKLAVMGELKELLKKKREMNGGK